MLFALFKQFLSTCLKKNLYLHTFDLSTDQYACAILKHVKAVYTFDCKKTH